MKSTIFTFATASSLTSAASAIRSSLTIVATSWRRGFQVTAAVVGMLAAVPALTATASSSVSLDNEITVEEMDMNMGVPCNSYNPRPITGNQAPCPGSIEEYCIQDDGFTSFVWEEPRAFSGNPPIGWKIISGQGTRCVKVLVGTKPGTMKVTVVHPQCGTKIATLPVMPANGFSVAITGPDKVCTNANITYRAVVSDSIKGRGNGFASIKGEFEYLWSVPAGWMIVSGQGTQVLVVTPGATGGQVSVNVAFAPSTIGGGMGIGLGKKKYCNTNASNSITVTVGPALGAIGTIMGDASYSLCSPIGCGHVFSIAAVTNATTYDWTVPAGMSLTGDGTASVSICFDGTITAGTYTISVTASNACGSASTDLEIEVEGCCPVVTAGPIIGPGAVSLCDTVTLCRNFSIDPIAGAISYTWETSDDTLVVTDGQGTDAVEICVDPLLAAAGFHSLKVTVVTACSTYVITHPYEIQECPINPLPVELVAFDVKSYNGGAMLNWRTSQEIDNKGFEIQRSTDGRTFTSIGWIDGHGNSSANVSYNFIDVKKLNGLNYYRLKQVDNSGKSEFSPVRTLRARITLGELTAYPNPTAGEITVNLPETVASRSILNLTSVDGKILWTRTLETGQSVPTSLDLSSYPAGIYLLNLSSDSDQQHLRITKE